MEIGLDDLCVRFIINIPEEDLSSVARICFQVEEAQWFYEDFIRPLDPSLPSMSLRIFCLRIFKHCPLLAHFSEENHLKAFEDFLEYKTRIPVRGAIMLNHEMDSAVLVKGWKKGASWTFPAGKINKAEDDLDCAVREVWEETGLDLQAARLIDPEAKPEYIELPIRGHQVRLYIFRKVPMDYEFQPQTRKEISRIEWYQLSDLPAFRKKSGQNNANDTNGSGLNNNKYYMIAPFMPPLKKWVAIQKRKEQKQAAFIDHGRLMPPGPIEEEYSESDNWVKRENYSQGAPAIETLDGASQELRRLLKVHIPGDGVQLPPQTSGTDKGSALLSILQAKGSAVPNTANPAPFYSQTGPQGAYNMQYSQPPPPQGSHHYGTQQPAAHPSQQPQTSYPPQPSHDIYNMIQPQGSSQYPYIAQAPNTNYQQPPHPHFPARSPVALIHPQPLPPQVQRAVFNKSTFQEPSKPQITDRNYQTNLTQKQHYSGPSEQAIPEVPTHQHVQTQANPVPLNGQSQALLDAFRRDAPAQELEQQHRVQPMKRPSVEVSTEPLQSQHYPQYGGQPTRQAPASSYPANTSQPLHHKSPTELASHSMNPPPSQQKSNLLGLFKKSGPDEQSMQQHQYQQQQVGRSVNQQAYPSHMEKSGSQNSNPYAQSDKQTQEALQKRMEHLALFSQPGSIPAAASHVSHIPSPQRHQQIGRNIQPPQNPPQAPVQGPIRILQRGQKIDSLDSSPVPPPGANPPPSEYQAPVPGQPGFPTSPPTISATGSGMSGSSDQKRQLLSLFGPKHSPASAMDRTNSQGSQQMAQPVGSSTTKRGENAMSPADQSFILDYLQSVTTNAK